MFCKIILFQLIAPPPLSEAWLVNCMSVRSVLRHEGVTTRSLKQLTRKNSYAALSSPHAPFPSFQTAEFFISEQNPLKASFLVLSEINSDYPFVSRLLIAWDNSNN